MSAGYRVISLRRMKRREETLLPRPYRVPDERVIVRREHGELRAVDALGLLEPLLQLLPVRVRG